MSDLVDFLLARISEDEAAIKARDLDRPIHFVGCYYYEYTLDANLFCDCDEDGAASKRVLAECDAKRRVVLGCTRERDNWVTVRPGVRENRPVREPWIEDDTAADVLRLLALPHADHPDYDEAWKP